MPTARTHCPLCNTAGHPAFRCRDEFAPTEKLLKSPTLISHLLDMSPYDGRAVVAHSLVAPTSTPHRQHALPICVEDDADFPPLGVAPPPTVRMKRNRLDERIPVPAPPPADPSAGPSDSFDGISPAAKAELAYLYHRFEQLLLQHSCPSTHSRLVLMDASGVSDSPLITDSMDMEGDPQAQSSSSPSLVPPPSAAQPQQAAHSSLPEGAQSVPLSAHFVSRSGGSAASPPLALTSATGSPGSRDSTPSPVSLCVTVTSNSNNHSSISLATDPRSVLIPMNGVSASPPPIFYTGGMQHQSPPSQP